MLNNLSVWLVMTPLIILGFGVYCKHLLENGKYAATAWYVSLAIHFVRIGALRIATGGGNKALGDTSLLFQVLGSDLVFAGITVINLVTFILYMDEQEFNITWFKPPRLFKRKTAPPPQSKDEIIEAEKKLIYMFQNYLSQSSNAPAPQPQAVKEKRRY